MNLYKSILHDCKAGDELHFTIDGPPPLAPHICDKVVIELEYYNSLDHVVSTVNLST